MELRGEDIRRFIEFSRYYNNLDAATICNIMNTCGKVVATEKRWDRLGKRSLCMGNGVEITIPVYSEKYLLPSGETLKTSDASMEEVNKLIKKGIVVGVRTKVKEASLTVFAGDEQPDYRLDLSMITDEWVDMLCQLESNGDMDMHDTLVVMITKYMNGASLDGAVASEGVLDALVSVLYRIGGITSQKYLIDYQFEIYNELISDLVDELEANYIRCLAGIST